MKSENYPNKWRPETEESYKIAMDILGIFSIPLSKRGIEPNITYNVPKEAVWLYFQAAEDKQDFIKALDILKIKYTDYRTTTPTILAITFDKLSI